MLGILIAILVAIDRGYIIALAQQINQWMPDERVPGYLDDTFTPYLLADHNQTVYALATQRIDEEHRKLAIVYRQWSLEKGWTIPVDILLMPSDDSQIFGAFLDSAGIMHIIFYVGQGTNRKIYYSHAIVTVADQVSAWSTPEVLGEGATSSISGAIAGDNEGNLIILYNGTTNGNGVYAIQSTNAGQNWSEPHPIFLTYDSELIPYSLRLYPGQKGILHAVWSIVTSNGVDNSLYYARYDTTLDLWSDARLLENRIEIQDYFGPSFPSIVDNGLYVVILYNSGNPFTSGPVSAGRPIQRVRLSSDNGQTWNDPVDPFPLHLGRSGEHALVVDSNQNVHAIFIQRIELSIGAKYSAIAGIWHSILHGNKWSEPERLITTIAPHDVRAIICQGNILLGVWREDPGEGQAGIWYSYKTLNTPELPVIPLPTISATPTDIANKTAIPAIILTSTHLSELAPVSQGDPVANNNPTLPLVIGIVPAILLLFGVIVIREIRRIRR